MINGSTTVELSAENLKKEKFSKPAGRPEGPGRILICYSTV
jgi:hypothetical protein